MDRFEATGEYIITAQKKDLHSSMDRFEATRRILFESKTSIYIPVWIDLKSTF